MARPGSAVASPRAFRVDNVLQMSMMRVLVARLIAICFDPTRHRRTIYLFCDNEYDLS